DATNYKPDQYQVKVEGIDVSDATATTNFNIVEGPVSPTVQPTGSETTVPPTQTATTTVPATTPTQPGFGALISLIGLGAVAFLVMRRN
ncbi:MAG: PGF-CTERM sorting domain-containing protein, partial [Methanofollis sp.]|uniref:PGF-CTERM sorting domain-containing protein n=1 Tax=Methanofollis sp. TaxID=2052835 RepID=UPI0026362660